MFSNVRKNFISFLILFSIVSIAILIATAILPYIQSKQPQKTQTFQYFIVAECSNAIINAAVTTEEPIDDLLDIRVIEAKLAEKHACKTLVVDFKLFRNQDEK